MKKLRFGAVRDVALFVGGLCLLAYETLGVPEPRAVLIAVAAGMIGLPATLLADRRFVSTPPEPSPPGPLDTGHAETKP